MIGIVHERRRMWVTQVQFAAPVRERAAVCVLWVGAQAVVVQQRRDVVRAR